MSGPTKEPPVFRGDKDIEGYLSRQFRITEGTHRGQLINFDNSPWMRKPLQKFYDDRVRRVLVIKATGCGGTYVAEGATMYAVNVSPVSIGYQVWTKPKAKRLATRLFNKLSRTDEFRRRVPSGVREKMTVEFRWPFSNLFVQEASESAAQADRLDWVLCDEPWLYPAGRISEFFDRTDGASLYDKHAGVSSAPRDDSHEWWSMWVEGCRDEYHLRCLKCGHLFLPTIGEESQRLYDGHYTIQWDGGGSLSHKASTVRFVCPSCHEEFRDKPSIRMALLEGADYVPFRPDASIEDYSCRWNCWIAWFTDMAETLKKYLVAKESTLSGDFSLLEDYVIKREARVFSGFKINDVKLHVTADYSLEIEEEGSPLDPRWSFWTAGPWIEDEREVGTDYFAGVDVQQSSFWMWVYQADPETSRMRLYWCGRVSTWSDVKVILDHIGVPPWQTGVDVSYNPDGETLRHIAEFGYVGLRGEDRDAGYQHLWEEGAESGKDVHPFSEIRDESVNTRERMTAEDKRYAKVIHWSHKRIFDHLWNLRNGKGLYWGLPANMDVLEHGPGDRKWTESEKISKQLDSTIYAKSTDTESNRKRIKPRMIWQKRTQKSQDHLWDASAQALVLMWVQGYFGA